MLQCRVHFLTKKFKNSLSLCVLSEILCMRRILFLSYEAINVMLNHPHSHLACGLWGSSVPSRPDPLVGAKKTPLIDYIRYSTVIKLFNPGGNTRHIYLD
jgi:hypothetical protein